jgi:hypothetical protein
MQKLRSCIIAAGTARVKLVTPGIVGDGDQRAWPTPMFQVYLQRC